MQNVLWAVVGSRFRFWILGRYRRSDGTPWKFTEARDLGGIPTSGKFAVSRRNDRACKCNYHLNCGKLRVSCASRRVPAALAAPRASGVCSLGEQLSGDERIFKLLLRRLRRRDLSRRMFGPDTASSPADIRPPPSTWKKGSSGRQFERLRPETRQSSHGILSRA